MHSLQAEATSMRNEKCPPGEGNAGAGSKESRLPDSTRLIRCFKDGGIRI